MTDYTCSVEECEKPLKVKKLQLCSMHYWRLTHNGTLDARPLYFSPEESFAARAKEVDGGCIEWTGARQNNGYGVMRISGKTVRAHRYSWERANGPIPEGIHIDHMCFNRACVNIEHLRAVTQAKNNQNYPGARSDSASGIRGVHWHKQAGKWAVRVKGKHCGLYAAKEEAARVAAEMRAELMPYSQN